MKVPVDESSLKMIEIGLDYVLGGPDENGDPVGIGEFPLHKLLDFWSGYDPTLEREISPDIYIYEGGPVLTERDVIRALIEEIRILRNESED